MLIFKPPVIAHRGASGYAPENTLVSMVKAKELGIKWVEFDVILTRDGLPILFHDDRLQRTTDGRGDPTQYNYDYLSTLDAGVWFDPIFSGERIPTLDSILNFIKEEKMSANIEIKPYKGHESLYVERILNVAERYFNLDDPSLLFSSFSMHCLKILREKAPEAPIGILIDQWNKDFEIEGCSVHIHEKEITPEVVATIKEMNKTLVCYTVNTVDRAKELYSLGVDAVFSDVPDLILRGIQ